MKKILSILICIFALSNINAQTEQKFLDEAVALVKIRSYVPSKDAKKCDVYAYLRAGNHSKKAKYIIEFRNGTMGNDIIFRERIDFRNINASRLVQSYRQKDDVYELFFGLWLIKENTIANILIVTDDGEKIKIPVEFTNYKNPITVMN